jgi:hypothetical protein
MIRSNNNQSQKSFNELGCVHLGVATSCKRDSWARSKGSRNWRRDRSNRGSSVGGWDRNGRRDDRGRAVGSRNRSDRFVGNGGALVSDVSNEACVFVADGVGHDLRPTVSCRCYKTVFFVYFVADDVTDSA